MNEMMLMESMEKSRFLSILLYVWIILLEKASFSLATAF